MKKQIFLLASLVLLTSILIAQSRFPEYSTENLQGVEKQHDNLKSTQDYTWLLDSTYNYLRSPLYDELVGNYKIIYSYDNNGNETGYIKYTWNSSHDNWVIYMKRINTYDSNENSKESIWSHWDTYLNEWVNEILDFDQNTEIGVKSITYNPINGTTHIFIREDYAPACYNPVYIYDM